MRRILACGLLILGGCATTNTVTKYELPDPPVGLMTSPEKLEPLPVEKDGSINAKDALGTIISNNTKAQDNSVLLLQLQNWILKTQKNIAQEGKTK